MDRSRKDSALAAINQVFALASRRGVEIEAFDARHDAITAYVLLERELDELARYVPDYWERFDRCGDLGIGRYETYRLPPTDHESTVWITLAIAT